MTAPRLVIPRGLPFYEPVRAPITAIQKSAASTPGAAGRR
jgi:hypothetical protein